MCVGGAAQCDLRFVIHLRSRLSGANVAKKSSSDATRRQRSVAPCCSGGRNERRCVAAESAVVLVPRRTFPRRVCSKRPGKEVPVRHQGAESRCPNCGASSSKRARVSVTMCKGTISAGQDSTDKRLDQITVAMHAKRTVQPVHRCCLSKGPVSEGVRSYVEACRAAETQRRMLVPDRPGLRGDPCFVSD